MSPILNFQNRAPNIKILKFHVNRDNSAYLEKYNFQWILVCQFWDCHWIRNTKMSSGVVSNPNFEFGWSWTQNKVNFILNFIVYLKKYDFLQTTSNIRKLYFVRKHQNKAPFSSDLLAKFLFCTKKYASDLGTIVWEMRTPSWRGKCAKHFGTKIG